MSERPNDTPDGPIDEPGAGPMTGNETIDVDGDNAPELEQTDEDFAEADAAGTTGSEAVAAEDEAAAKAAEEDVQRDRAMRPTERRAARAAERAQIPIDPSLRIKDPASALFVVLTVVVFGLILLNGLVLGKGGLLTPPPTLAPIPTVVPSTAPTAAPTATPTAAPTETPAAS